MLSPAELRTGMTPWAQRTVKARAPDEFRHTIVADILIIGAGITGAFLAEAFSRSGKKIVVLDRNRPQTASTMASTSLLLWEIDASLTELTERLGFDRAVRIYQNSLQAVRYIASLVVGLKLDCGFMPRHGLYLEGNKLSGASFRNEAALREKAGLPCAFLPPETLAETYGFPPRAAIRSGGNAEADPVALARELLNAAITRDATVISPANVTDFDFESGKVYARTEQDIEIVADALVLATGYEIPPFVPAAMHRIVSTYVIATEPQDARLWPGHDLIWEAAMPYCYMRSALDARIIIGGEDEKIDDAGARDAMLPQKVKMLQAKLRALLPHANIALDYKWAAFFGITDDSLPLIGQVPGIPHAYAAYGYGGNGITFSALAAQVLRDEILGLESTIPAKDAFALDRT